MKQRYRSFAQFYVFYLSQHRTAACRRLHFAGLVLGLAALVVIGITGRWSLLPIAPLIGYGFGWIGHFVFEKNRPATLSHPLYSFLGDFAMARDILRGHVRL